MRRVILLAAVTALALPGVANAETWYAVEVARGGAVLVDVDSRKTDGNPVVVVRMLHAKVQQYRGTPIVGSQFIFEVDCKGHQMRTIDFAAIDGTGKIPPDLDKKQVQAWSGIKPDTPAVGVEAFACDGRIPDKAKGPYKFEDFVVKYFRWQLDNNAAEFLGK